MKNRLLWKLLLINIPVIAVTILVVWLAIDHLAAGYFMVLMDRYMVSPTETHQAFLDAVHRYLVWAALASLALALLLSYLLTRRVLHPLSQMNAVTREIGAGHFSRRVAIVSGDEIGQLGTALNRMADSLEQMEKLRRNMVSDLAHELRTPLTNLRGYLEGLSDQVIPPSRDTFDLLQRETLRLVKLVEDLQQLTRAEAARAYLHRQEISLAETIEQMLALYSLPLGRKEIAVETRFDPLADRVKADRDRVLQAVRNLVENACNYTPKGGSVTISTERTAEGVRAVFANTGAGIAEEDLPYIFERFFRADRSRSREGGGAGIGLAIVRELIEAHGGRVGAASGAGTTRVWFTLPG